MSAAAAAVLFGRRLEGAAIAQGLARLAAEPTPGDRLPESAMTTTRTSRPRGLYRERLGPDTEASVYLSYGRHGYSVSADRYVHEGHAPAFNTLPWKDDYDAARRPPEGGDRL